MIYFEPQQLEAELSFDLAYASRLSSLLTFIFNVESIDVLVLDVNIIRFLESI